MLDHVFASLPWLMWMALGVAVLVAAAVLVLVLVVVGGPAVAPPGWRLGLMAGWALLLLLPGWLCRVCGGLSGRPCCSM